MGTRLERFHVARASRLCIACSVEGGSLASHLSPFRQLFVSVLIGRALQFPSYSPPQLRLRGWFLPELLYFLLIPSQQQAPG